MLFFISSCAMVFSPLHVLSLVFWVVRNNAGIMACPFTLSEDGIELQFATNHVGEKRESETYVSGDWTFKKQNKIFVAGHFLLTNMLLDKIKNTAKETRIQGRIVNVSSRAIILVTQDLYAIWNRWMIHQSNHSVFFNLSDQKQVDFEFWYSFRSVQVQCVQGLWKFKASKLATFKRVSTATAGLSLPKYHYVVYVGCIFGLCSFII